MIKFCSASEKEKYWIDVQKKIDAMNVEQLIWLYNIHGYFLLKPSKNDDYQIRHYKTFNDLTYSKIKRFTSPANYPTLLQLIDLILAGYNYQELLKIIFDIDLEDEDYVA